MTCSDATLRALELPRLLAVLAELAASDLGREWLLQRAPYSRPEDLAEARSRFEEVGKLLEEGRLVPDVEEPFAGLLKLLEPGRDLQGTDLLRLGGLLQVALGGQRRVQADPDSCPALGRRLEALELSPSTAADVSRLVERIRQVLNERGEVADGASPRLLTLRSNVKRRRDRLYSSFDRYIQDHRDRLGEETASLRDGRLTVLLPSGSRGRLPGLLHGRSATGRSYYFEPLELVEENNELQQAQEEETAERRRLLQELMQQAMELREVALRMARLYTELDGLQALHDFARRTEAQLAEIGDVDDDAERDSATVDLRLLGGRHPLLDPRLADLRRQALGSAGHTGEVEPLDLDFADGRVLVLTGPNAGGKTVALKTLGLLVLMQQSGLPVPCGGGTRLPFFVDVVAVVGDEQDLLADRSTFSGRLLRLKEAWEAAGPHSLVLLDEVGSGTNPQEGGALAVAMLEGLVERGGPAVMTTHLMELAAAALELPAAGCLAMEFDAESHLPTFRLRSGPPAASEALSLARRLGLPAAWLERAEHHLGPDHRQLQHLLEETERLRVELSAERLELQEVLAEQRRRAEELERQRSETEEEGRRLARRYREEVEAWRSKVERRLRDEIERLGAQSLGAKRRRSLQREAVQRVVEEPPEIGPGEEVEEVVSEVVEGARVRHRQLGWVGVVERLQRGDAEVAVRGKRIRCSADELLPVSEAPDRAQQGRPARRRRASGSVQVPETPSVPSELNLIGQRVDRALEELDSYLDRALLASAQTVRVVHGHGSGKLRRAVRDHLKVHPAVADHAPGERSEGGDGATVVRLRGGEA